jgi:hypothetical protein
MYFTVMEKRTFIILYIRVHLFAAARNVDRTIPSTDMPIANLVTAVCIIRHSSPRAVST